MPRASSPTSIDTLMARRVQRSARGTVFTAASFAGSGGRAAIDKALQRLVAAGALRRLSRGLYDKPVKDDVLGALWPSVDAVVRAVAGWSSRSARTSVAICAAFLANQRQNPATGSPRRNFGSAIDS